MTIGKITALTIQTFVGKVMSLLFNMLSKMVIAFLPRSKRLFISRLQSPSAGILEPKKTVSLFPLFLRVYLPEDIVPNSFGYHVPWLLLFSA